MEQKIFFLINQQWTNPSLDRLMAIFTNWGFWMPFILGGGFLLWIFGDFRMRIALLCAVLGIAIVDPVVVGSLKKLIGRPRPHMALKDVREVELADAHPRIFALAKPLDIQYSPEPSLTPMRGPSFPSAHAANNFAVATVFFLFFRKWGWILFISAALVSYSRIYVGAHWPLDVLAASLIGIVVGWVLTAWAEWGWRRWGPRLFPQLAGRYLSLLKKTKHS